MANNNMNSVERRELAKVVKAEFENLRNEISARLKDKRDNQEEEVKLKYKKQLEAVSKAAEKHIEKVKKAQADVDLFVSQKVAEGYRLTNGNGDYNGSRRGALVTIGYGGTNFSSTEMEDDLRQLRGAYDKDLRDAINFLARRETSVLKELSLSVLETDQARQFLGNIPDANAIIEQIGNGAGYAALEAAG
jgi:hypothetical protein